VIRVGELCVAVVGPGDVARRDYLPEFHRLAGRARLELVCGRSPARTERVAADFGAARWSTDWHDALGDGIDVVVNLTPAPAHGEINLAAVRAGKHLYSEKPVARDRDEGARIAEAAAASRATVVAAPSVMVFPQVRRAADLLAAGTIGAVHSVRAHGTAPPPPWLGYDSDIAPFFSAEVGPLSDMGVYPLHAVTGLLGPAVEVAAMSGRTRSDFTVSEGPHAGQRVAIESDDNWQVILRLAGGALATVQSNFCMRQAAGPDLELDGELGTIAVSLIDGAHPVRVFTDERGWIDEPVEHARAAGPDHLLGVEHLVDCVEHGGQPVASLAHARHVVDIRVAAAASARSGRFVDVESEF
jgi:predicted dehydrogenase